MYRIIILVFAVSARAQLTLPGTCDTTSIANTPFLNLTIVSKWHEVERTPNRIESGQCATVSVLVQNATVPIHIVSNREVVNKTAVYNNGTIVSLVNGEITTVNFTGLLVNLRVLKSDFTNYAIIYSCQNVANNTKEVFGWKLSKNTALSATDVTAINEALKASDLQNATWLSISHTEENCKVNSAATIQISFILMCLVAVLCTNM